jgi:hypothetical protein
MDSRGPPATAKYPSAHGSGTRRRIHINFLVFLNILNFMQILHFAAILWPPDVPLAPHHRLQNNTAGTNCILTFSGSPLALHLPRRAMFHHTLSNSG